MNCDIIHIFRSDFSALWQCKRAGGSLQITTPFVLPNSILLSIYLTEREGRYIACDGGVIAEMIEENCDFPPDEVAGVIDSFKSRFGVSQAKGPEGILYYISCSDQKLITSISFDLSNFVLAVMTTLSAEHVEEEEKEPGEPNFNNKATTFLSSLNIPSLNFVFHKELESLKGIKFSAIASSNDRYWIFSYIAGSTVTNFRKNTIETIWNFDQADKSRVKGRIASKISLIHDRAKGYKRGELAAQLGDLESKKGVLVLEWENKKNLLAMLT